MRRRHGQRQWCAHRPGVRDPGVSDLHACSTVGLAVCWNTAWAHLQPQGRRAWLEQVVRVEVPCRLHVRFPAHCTTAWPREACEITPQRSGACLEAPSGHATLLATPRGRRRRAAFFPLAPATPVLSVHTCASQPRHQAISGAVRGSVRGRVQHGTVQETECSGEEREANRQQQERGIWQWGAAQAQEGRGVGLEDACRRPPDALTRCCPTSGAAGGPRPCRPC